MGAILSVQMLSESLQELDCELHIRRQKLLIGIVLALYVEWTWDVIRRYGTQPVKKVGLNHPIMCEVLDKLMGPTEFDSLVELVTEESADEYAITKSQSVKQAKKGQKKLKNKAGSKTVDSKVSESKASTVMKSLA